MEKKDKNMYENGQHFVCGLYVTLTTNNTPLTSISYGKVYTILDTSDRYSFGYYDKAPAIRVVNDNGNKHWVKAHYFKVLTEEEAKGYDTMGTNVVALEHKTPTLMVEVKIDTNSTDGNLVEVGEYEKYDSVSAARNAARAKITEQIRKTNDYPMFRIYRQDSIAQAKEPPVEFTNE